MEGTVILGLGITGIIGLVKKYLPTLPSEAWMLIAIILGAVAGFFGFFVTDVVTGAGIGAASVGTYQIAKRAGGN